MKPIIPGPTYAEMRNPLLLPDGLRQAANTAGARMKPTPSTSSILTGRIAGNT